MGTSDSISVGIDDIAIHFGNSHYPYYNASASMTTTQDVDRANLKIIRIEL